MDHEDRPAILLMFSVKLVQEVHVAEELIPEQHAVPGISQPSWEPAGDGGYCTHSDDWGCSLTMKPKVKKQHCLSLAHTCIPSTREAEAGGLPGVQSQSEPQSETLH